MCAGSTVPYHNLPDGSEDSSPSMDVEMTDGALLPITDLGHEEVQRTPRIEGVAAESTCDLLHGGATSPFVEEASAEPAITRVASRGVEASEDASRAADLIRPACTPPLAYLRSARSHRSHAGVSRPAAHACMHDVNHTRRAGGDADDRMLAIVEQALRDDPPIECQGPRHAREFLLADVSDWPRFHVVVLGCHTGVDREMHAERGMHACSVARRRSILAPSETCMHIIGAIEDFLAVYPHTPDLVDAHPTCAASNRASKATWAEKVADGTMLSSAYHMLDCLSFGRRAALEQPPSAMESIIGPPAFKTNELCLGGTRFKDIWYWTRGTLPAPAEERTVAQARALLGGSAAMASTVTERDPELRMLLRSTTSPHVARRLVAAWLPLQPCDSEPWDEASRLQWLLQAREQAQARYTVFAARFAPVVRAKDLARQRCIVLVPFAFREGHYAHVALRGLFGVVARADADLKTQAIAASAHLCGGCEPYLAGYERDTGHAHAIFVLPVVCATPLPVDSASALEALARASESSPASLTLPRSAWCRSTVLRDDERYNYIVWALARLQSAVTSTVPTTLRIGCWERPVHLVPARLADAWNRSASKPTANTEWQTFLLREAERGDRMRKAFCAADRGDGAMIEWAGVLRTAADFASELICPPQGLPRFDCPVLRLYPMPQPPPAVSTAWLHSLPPQCLPPGFPESVEWTEVLLRWGRIKFANTMNSAAEREFCSYDMTAEQAMELESRHAHLILGPGAFHMRRHADGLGEYCMNSVILECGDDGLLRPLDFTRKYEETRNIDFLRALFGGESATDQELMSFLAQGARFKACMPAELRLMRNVRSMDGRASVAARTFVKLLRKNIVRFKPVRYEADCVRADGPCPVLYIPGTVGSSGAQDKPGRPDEKRMVVNNTAPNGDIAKPVRARNRPHGEPDGAHVVSRNDATGERTPGPKRVRFGRPSAWRLETAPAPTCGAICAEPVDSEAALCVDVRFGGEDSDLANPFTPCGQDHALAYERCWAAIGKAYDSPDLRLDDIALGYEGVRVHRHSHGYDGHVLVRAVQRLAKRVRAGEHLVLCCPCRAGSWCHRHQLVDWTRELVEKGLHHRVPHPFPDPEVKMRPADNYAAYAVLKHMALVDADGGADDADVYGVQDDESIMFWQIRTAVSEYPHDQFHVAVRFTPEEMAEFFQITCEAPLLVYVVGVYLGLNMGGRPCSKIACRYAEQKMAAWRVRMDDIVAQWLPTRSLALQDLLRERAAELGPTHARPFWSDLYTDDYTFAYLSADLAAQGTAEWHALNKEARVEMAAIDKKGGGTVVDCIGARHVLSGGFGTVTPAKRARVLSACSMALSDNSSMTREQFEANNGLICHVDEILDFPRGTTHGMWRPLQLSGHPNDLVHLTKDASAAYAKVIELVSMRAGASFLSAIMDAPEAERQASVPPPVVTTASDACTDARFPSVFGWAQGVVYIFELDAAWLLKTINVLEGVGRGINRLVFPKIFPAGEIVNEGDNVASCSSALHRGDSDDMHALQLALERQVSYADTARRSQENAIAGIANEIADAGSRAKWDVLNAIAAALGVRMQWLDLALYPEVDSFLTDVFANTSNKPVCEHPDPPRFVCQMCGAPVSAIQRAMRRCDVCPGPPQPPQRMRAGGPMLPAYDSDDEAAALPPIGDVASTSEAQLSRMIKADDAPRIVLAPLPIRQAALAAALEEHSPPGAALPAPPAPSPANAHGSMAPAAPSPPMPGSEPQKRPDLPTMPRTAEAARSMVYSQLEELLSTEAGDVYSMAKGGPDALHAMIANSSALVLKGVPPNTLKSDNTGIGYAVLFCLETNQPFVRPHILATPAAEVNEAYFYARLVVRIHELQRPRSKRCIGKDGLVITDAKPSSALTPLYGYRRVLKDGGCQLPSLSMVTAHMKGIVQEYKDRWGARALIPRRAQPFSRPQLLALEADMRAKGDVQALAEFTYGLSTGTRADELCEKDCLKRGNLVLVRDNREYEMTPENLMAARDGDYIKANSGPAKCDQDGTEWGDRNMWFRVDFNQPLNAAASYIAYELAHPCPLEQRDQWPAFGIDGGSKPKRTRTFQSKFDERLRSVLGAEEARRRSWHSLRAQCASALGKNKLPDGVVQMLVRWKTPEAMRLYNKMDAAQYADYVDLITTTELDVLSPLPPAPQLDHYDVVASMEEAVADLSMDEATAAAMLLDNVMPSAKKTKRAPTAAATLSRAASDSTEAAPGAQRTERAMTTSMLSVGDAQVEVVCGPSCAEAGRLALVHNSLWPAPECSCGAALTAPAHYSVQPAGCVCDWWDVNGYTTCTVMGRCAQPYHFPNARRRADAFVIQCDGENYPVKAAPLLEAVARQERSARASFAASSEESEEELLSSTEVGSSVADSPSQLPVTPEPSGAKRGAGVGASSDDGAGVSAAMADDGADVAASSDVSAGVNVALPSRSADTTRSTLAPVVRLRLNKRMRRSASPPPAPRRSSRLRRFA